MSHIGMLVLLSTLMGSGTDLLDYVPSDDYWKAKGVTAVTADALVTELEPPKAGADISKLVPDLGSPEVKVRDAAASKVRAMGPGVIPQLRELAKNDDPEIAGRARQLISDISNGAKATQVRRLMAIRTLGEKKAKEALPRLQELTNSDEPFVADYAKAAVAAIDGKPYERRHDPAGDDAWLLPEDCRAVLHFATRGGGPVDYAAAMKAIPALGPHGDRPPGAAPAPQKPEEVRKQVVDHVIKTADKTGNIRLDGFTVGVAGDVGDNTGYVAIIVHGEFDAKAVSSLIGGLLAGAHKHRHDVEPGAPVDPPEDAANQVKVVDGVEVYSPEDSIAFFLPTNKHGVFIAGPDKAEKPVAKLITAAKSGKGGLAGAEEMVNLIKTVDTKQPVWGALHVTDVYRQAPVLAAFDTLTLVGKPKAGEAAKQGRASLDFRLEGKGKDPQQVKNAVDLVNNGIAEGRRQMKEMEKMMAQGGGGGEMAAMGQVMKQIGEVLETVQCKADGGNASLTATVNEGVLFNPLIIFFGGFGFRAEVELNDAGPAVQGGRVEVAPDPPPPPQPQPDRKP